MSIAFPALVITLLVLPGVLFSYAYRKGVWQSPVGLGPLQSELGRGILFALPINMLCIWLIGIFSQKAIDFEAILLVLAGWPAIGEQETQKYITSIASNPVYILWFVFLTNVFSVLLGTSAHCVVRWLRLDLKHKYLRFSNEWYYLFSGEALFFDHPARIHGIAEVKKRIKAIDLVFVAAVVEQGDSVYLYRGILSNYYFDKSGRLDKLVFDKPQRRLITSDSKSYPEGGGSDGNRFYRIFGHFFVLDYAEIKNLSIHYYSFLTETESPDNPSEPSGNKLHPQESPQVSEQGIERVLSFEGNSE